ncbi:MAG: nucleotide sugar dehydrogenase [Candidatus Bathyarchaeia archaeon]
MHLKSGENMMMSDAAIKESKDPEPCEKFTVCVVGCGRSGILHACLFVEAGVNVICADEDRTLVERVSKGRVPFLRQEVEPVLRKNLDDGRLRVTSNLEGAVTLSNIIVVTTPTEINEKDRVDYSNIEKNLKRIGLNLRKNTLVIITSVVGVNVTENILKEVLENTSGLKLGVDFYLAYSPVLDWKTHTLKSLANYKRIVAAFDENSLEKASDFLGSVTKTLPIKTMDVRAAETAILLEAMRRKIGSVLANEFAFFCEKIGVDYLTVQSLLTADLGEFVQPTLDCTVDNELLILSEDAESHNIKLRTLAVSLESNKEMLRHAVALIQEALKSCGKTTRRARVALLGISQNRNIMDTPKNSLKMFVGMLERRGVKLSLYDPYLPQKFSTELELPPIKENLTEALEGADCVVIFTGHDQFKRLNLKKLKLLMKMPAAIVDFEGILDPVKVESEGFVYRGLGRGLRKNG